MDPTNFDRIAKFFAERRLSRRHALQQLGVGGLAAGLVGSRGAAAAPTPHPLAAAATFGREATEAFVPLAAPAGAAAIATPASSAASKPVTFMFAQSFEGGSLVPVSDKAGRYTLTLPHGLGQTIYFSDRPQRIVGIVPTPQFLKGLGFPPRNPPNAVLIGHESPTHEDLVVMELLNPRYDTATNTATYEAQVLQDTHKLGLEFTQTPDEEAKVARTYTDAHLFIDDCPDIEWCYNLGLDPVGVVPGWPIGTCWSWGEFRCVPCDGKGVAYYNQLCNDTYPVNGCYQACTVWVV